MVVWKIYHGRWISSPGWLHWHRRAHHWRQTSLCPVPWLSMACRSCPWVLQPRIQVGAGEHFLQGEKHHLSNLFFLEPFPLNGQKGVKPHELAISIEYQDESKNLFILEMICRHLLFHAFQYFYWVARMSRSRRPQLGFQPHFPA